MENGPRWGRDIRFSHSDDTFVLRGTYKASKGGCTTAAATVKENCSVSAACAGAQAVTGDLFMYADAQNDEKGVHKNETGSAFA